MVPDRGTIVLGSRPLRDTIIPGPGEEDTRGEVNRGLDVCVSIKPNRECQEVSEVIHRDYHALIVAGTLSRAMSMEDREWTNDQKASSWAIRYEHLLSHARSAIDRGFTTKSQRVTPRSFT